MKKERLAYLLCICIMAVSNITLFIMLIYFGQLSNQEIIQQSVRNPFFLVYILIMQILQIAYINSTHRQINRFHKTQTTKISVETLQKKIVKYPSHILFFNLVHSFITPQFFLIGFQSSGELVIDLTLVSSANMFLVGIPFYIFFIRNFEDYCAFIPFSSKYLSMKLSIRTLLVTVFSLYALVILIYLAIKVSSVNLGLNQEQINTIVMKATPMMIYGVLMSITCLYLLMMGINKRIILAQNSMEVLSRRDYSQNSIPVPSRDEIGVLIDEVNLVQDDTGQLLREISNQMGKTIKTKESMITVAEESSSAMTQMDANIQSVGNSINHLDKNITNVTDSMKTLNQFIHNLTNNMNEQAGAQDESIAAIDEMTASIDNIAQITENKMKASQDLQKVSDKGETILKDTIEQISKIFNSLDNIKDMTKIILAISSQTNLLAMNAAIEAAHAGEAGRGFSVVADEIRKLAETSSKNSKHINESIKEIVKLVEGATESGGKTTEAFNAISQGIHETLDSLSEISSSMGELKVGGTQVISAAGKIRENSKALAQQSNNMQEETEKVNQAAEDLTQISTLARESMNEMAIGAKEVLESSLSLNDHASELDQSSKDLENWIKKFTI